MPRTITTATNTALNQATIRLAILVDLEFTSDYHLRLWTGIGNVTWDGNVYLGNGWLKPIQGLDESNELKATGCEVLLTGVGSDIMALVLDFTNQRSEGRVYLATLDSNGDIIDDPIPLFVGNLDVPEIYDSPSESTIRLKYESELIKLGRASEFRYTNAAQKGLYPDDRGFEYMAALEDWHGFWGKAKEKKKKKESQKPRKNKH